MKKYLIALMIFIAVPTFAANTTGFAWSESVGWFDFKNVTVTNTAVSGHAYNDNTGWLVMDGVSNINGQLTGYAWSESVGYFNFASTTIQNGAFKGYAYNDNTGWLSFETGTNVTTSLAPVVVAPPAPPVPTSSGPFYGGGGGFSSIPASLQTPTTQPQVNTPTTIPNITVPTNVNLQTNPQINTTLGNSRNLTQNTRGTDVKLLQQFLNQQGFTVSNKGAGSPGLETTLFGKQTKQALIRFQIKNNIKPASGNFGPKTKAFIKTLNKTN